MEECHRRTYGQAQVLTYHRAALCAYCAVIFRDMKQFEDVDLINSKLSWTVKPKAMDGSLYEAVDTKEKYVDVCLKRYLLKKWSGRSCNSLLKLFSFRNNSQAFDLEGSIEVETPDDHTIVITRQNKDQTVTAVARIDLAEGTYQVTENGQEMVF